MQVEKDIEAARGLIKGDIEKYYKMGYRRIKLFTNRPLKFFKKYNLNNKDVLSKYETGDEVIDLLSYGANVTCYSSNRLDEYFLYLKLAFLSQNYNDFFTFYFNKYKNSFNAFTKEGYLKVRDNLDEKTRYFFDEIFKLNIPNILKTRLFTDTTLSYDILKEHYIRYFINSRYYEARNNLETKKVEFILATDGKIPSKLDGKLFNFINLSYNMDKEKLEYIKSKIQSYFVPMLAEYGKIQCFVLDNDIDIDGYKKIEVNGIQPSLNMGEERKTYYAYVYKNV